MKLLTLLTLFAAVAAGTMMATGFRHAGDASPAARATVPNSDGAVDPSGYSVEEIPAAALDGISEEMRASLQQAGARIVGEGKVLCEVWLRDSIPLMKGSRSADYTTIPEGTFMGVIHYPEQAGDYRGQAIAAGTYAMRNLVIPTDGNHLGVSLIPDFFLLTPVANDSDPAVSIGGDALIELSKQASGTSHPTPLSLADPEGHTGMHESEEGHWVFETSVPAQAEGKEGLMELSLAIILVGKAEG